MKKILIIAVVFLSLNTFAQKTVTIYNLSSTNFDILGEIGTQSSSASQYPKFKSNYGTAPNNIIHIPAGTTYILTCTPASTARFPFLSTSSTPQITSWMRQLTAGSAWTALPSNVVFPTYSLTQYINYIKCQVGPNGTLGGGTLTVNSSNLFSDSYNFYNGVGAVTMDVVSPILPYYPVAPNYDGETFVIVTD